MYAETTTYVKQKHFLTDSTNSSKEAACAAKRYKLEYDFVNFLFTSYKQHIQHVNLIRLLHNAPNMRLLLTYYTHTQHVNLV